MLSRRGFIGRTIAAVSALFLPLPKPTKAADDLGGWIVPERFVPSLEESFKHPIVYVKPVTVSFEIGRRLGVSPTEILKTTTPRELSEWDEYLTEPKP